jgi:hypothetical protein
MRIKSNNNKAFILKRINILSRLTLDPRNYYYDEEQEEYEVIVDETKFGKRTDYSIHMSKLHQVNYFDYTEGEQKLQNATYQRILHVLKEFLLDIFIIDRKAHNEKSTKNTKRKTRSLSHGHTNTNHRTTRKKNSKNIIQSLLFSHN